MKRQLFQNKIKVKKSPIHGWGVFADKDIKEGELIEECYAILATKRDLALRDYYFAGGNRNCVPMGYAMIYNHSDTPNATYEFDSIHSIVKFRAIKFISKGDEIFTSYGTEWFSSRNMKIKKLPWWFKTKRFFLKNIFYVRLTIILVFCYLIFLLLQHFS